MIIKKSEILDDRGQRLIGKYLLGGAAAGTSAALATSLVNYYRTLQQEAAAEGDTSKDDDILYLNLRKNPTNAPKKVRGTQASQQAKVASISGGLAITGGALAGLGSYAAVRKLYQKYKKKRMQEQLDAAQQGFFDVVSQEASAEKRAAMGGKPMGGVEFATSMPVTLTLLAALASGALTHKALEKTFPRAKKPQSPEPKKIVIRNQEDPSFYETVQEEDDNGIPTPKEASYDSRNDYDTYCDGLELLVHMCLGREKVASISDLHNMVGAIVEGRKQEVIDNIMSLGFDAAMDLCKGAHETIKKASAQDIAVAVGTCVHTPELHSITSLLAASEYDDMAPHFSKAASEQPKHVKQLLCKIAGNLGAYGRACIFENATVSIKEAAAPPMDIEQLLEIIQMLQQNPQGQQPGAHMPGGSDENPEDQQTLLSTDSESSEEAMGQGNNGETPASNKPKVINKKQVTVEADPKDEIDQMLAGSGAMG